MVVRERVPVATLRQRVRDGAGWRQLLVPGVEITDISIVIVSVGDLVTHERNRMYRVRNTCCGGLADMQMNGLLSRIRRRGALCRSCAILRVGRLSAERNRLESMARAIGPPDHGSGWAFGLMNAALAGAGKESV